MPTIPTRRDANGISARNQPQITLTTPNSVAPKSTKPRKLLVGRMKSLLPVRKSSRRKNPAPRANCTSFGDPRVVIPTQNNDYCESCKGLGTFLCCDSCPRSFHLTCLNPPMDQDSIPEDEWHCNSCSPIPLPKGYKRDGLFGNTLEVIHSSNPISFEIPEEIKSCFRGVDTNEYGEFVDTTMLVNPKNKVLTIKSGWTRVLELRDKDAIVICYYCRLSGLRGPIIACDYCSLNWHMDCLTPPLAVPPPPHLKWMCPNHVDHLLPKARFGLLDIDSQQDAHLGLIPSLMNSLPVDEEEIMSSFLGRMQKKRKIDRFSQFLQEAETDIFAKLLDPKTLLSNHAALIKSFPSAFPSDPWLYTPRPPDLGAIEANQTSKRDSIQALLNIFKGHTSKHPPSDQDTFVEMPRTLFHRLNAIGKLMSAVPQEELLDFLVRNPKE